MGPLWGDMGWEWMKRNRCVYRKLEPKWMISVFSVRLAHVEEIKNCWKLPLSIWETCLATITVIKMEMIVVAALIVPSASWISAIRVRHRIGMVCQDV